MTRSISTPDDLRLQAHEAAIRRQHTSAHLAQCQQLAWTLHWRTLDHGLSAGWKGRLLDEATAAIGWRFSNMSNADIMALVFIVLREAVKSANEDLKDIMAGVKNINKHKEAIRELLLQMVDKAEGRAIRWPPP